MTAGEGPIQPGGESVAAHSQVNLERMTVKDGRIRELLVANSLSVELWKLTREDLVKALLRRHEGRLAAMRAEVERNTAIVKELEPKAKKLKDERDSITARVAELKAKRNALQDVVRKKKTEFFNLADRAEKLEEKGSRMGVYKKRVNDLQWKLQTEGITLADEKRYIEDTRAELQKMAEAVRSMQEKDEVGGQLALLIQQIGGEMSESQAAHKELVELANGSQKLHEEYVVQRSALDDARRLLSWLPDRVRTLEEVIGYWRQRLEGKNQPGKIAEGGIEAGGSGPDVPGK